MWFLRCYCLVRVKKQIIFLSIKISNKHIEKNRYLILTTMQEKELRLICLSLPTLSPYRASTNCNAYENFNLAMSSGSRSKSVRKCQTWFSAAHLSADNWFSFLPCAYKSHVWACGRVSLHFCAYKVRPCHKRSISFHLFGHEHHTFQFCTKTEVKRRQWKVCEDRRAPALIEVL